MSAHSMRPARLLFFLAAAAAAATALPGARVYAQEPVAQYTALAVNMTSARAGSATGTVNINVNRWSTDAERDRLMTVLLEKGEKALLGVLREMPRAGSIAPTGGVGFEVRFARRTPGPDGSERVVLLTDRPISFWERQDGGRSNDYPFTLIEMRIGPNGEGEGKISVAASIVADKVNNTIVLENYSDQPVRLQGLRKIGK
jgi:hypothetical protein